MSRKRVLIVRMGSMGDIVHTLPVAAALKDSFPDWEIDWLVEKRWSGLLDGNDCISQVMEIDTMTWRKKWRSARTLREFLAFRKRLRNRQYDYAIDAQSAIKSAICCRLSGAERAIGFEKQWLKESVCRFLYSKRVVPTGVHVVDINLSLAKELGAAIGSVRFPLPSGDPSRLPSSLQQARYAVLSPGAGWRSKCWPPEHYAELADRLHRECGLDIVLNCGPGEEELADEVRKNAKAANPVVFQSDLNGLIALLRRSKLMVGSDSGPVHLAAALGVPTLAIFGPTDPGRNGPYGKSHRSIRRAGTETTYRHSPEESGAMRSIRPEEAFGAIRELLGAELDAGAAAAEKGR